MRAGDLLLELSRVKREAMLGQGTAATTTPCSGALDLTVAYSTKAITGPGASSSTSWGTASSRRQGGACRSGAMLLWPLRGAAGGDDGAVDLLPDGFYDSGAEAQRLFSILLSCMGAAFRAAEIYESRLIFTDTETLPAAPDLLLELAREAGGVLGQRHGCDDDPVRHSACFGGCFPAERLACYPFKNFSIELSSVFEVLGSSVFVDVDPEYGQPVSVSVDYVVDQHSDFSIVFGGVKLLYDHTILVAIVFGIHEIVTCLEGSTCCQACHNEIFCSVLEKSKLPDSSRNSHKVPSPYGRVEAVAFGATINGELFPHCTQSTTSCLVSLGIIVCPPVFFDVLA